MSEPQQAPLSILSFSPGERETNTDGSQSNTEPNASSSKTETKAETATSTPSTVPYGPDGMPLAEFLGEIPEQFKTQDGKIKWAEIVKSYNHLRQRLSKKEEDLKTIIRAEMAQAAEEIRRDPAAYYAIPDGSPFVVSDERDAKFLDVVRREFASWGMDKKSWETIVSAFSEWVSAREPDPRAEIAAIGDRAAERIASVRDWLAANLPAEEFDAIVKSVKTARGFIALERLVERAMRGSTFAPTAAVQQNPLTEADIKRLMADPEYWSHSTRGEQIRKIVADWFKAKTRSSSSS